MLGQTYYINIHRFPLFYGWAYVPDGPVQIPKVTCKSRDLNAYAPVSHSDIHKSVSGTCMETDDVSHGPFQFLHPGQFHFCEDALYSEHQRSNISTLGPH